MPDADLATLFQAPSLPSEEKPTLPKDPLHIHHFLTPEALSNLKQPPAYNQLAWKLHSEHLCLD